MSLLESCYDALSSYCFICIEKEMTTEYTSFDQKVFPGLGPVVLYASNYCDVKGNWHYIFLVLFIVLFERSRRVIHLHH